MNIAQATHKAYTWYIEATPKELVLFSAEHNDVTSATEIVALKALDYVNLTNIVATA